MRPYHRLRMSKRGPSSSASVRSTRSCGSRISLRRTRCPSFARSHRFSSARSCWAEGHRSHGRPEAADTRSRITLMYHEQTPLHVVGQLLVAFLFLGTGIVNVTTKFRQHLDRMTAVGVPCPKPLLVAGFAMQFAGGLLVALDW